MKGEFLDVIFDCPCFGLLGLMTALPTTSEFITYDAVYLPKNHFIKQETLSTEDYLAYFFPFDKISFVKKGQESMWNTDNREMANLMNGLPRYSLTGLLPLLPAFCIIRIMMHWRKQNGMCTEKEWNVLAALHRLTT